MFEVTIGKEGLGRSWQASFPEVTQCVHCPGISRVGFVAFEDPSLEPVSEQLFVCDLYQNDPDGEGY